MFLLGLGMRQGKPCRWRWWDLDFRQRHWAMIAFPAYLSRYPSTAASRRPNTRDGSERERGLDDMQGATGVAECKDGRAARVDILFLLGGIIKTTDPWQVPNPQRCQGTVSSGGCGCRFRPFGSRGAGIAERSHAAQVVKHVVRT